VVKKIKYNFLKNKNLKMKIFIFGANGMLGNYICSYLSKKYKIISFIRKDYDLGNLSINSLKSFLLDNNNLEENDIVINCAGVIPQSSKQRELNARLYFIINSLFPIILSMICLEYNSKLIHITTDCVFSGKDGKYNELSIPDETNDYGISKSLGDLCEATIIRTSIIGEEINNKRSLVEWVKSNKGNSINGYTNHYWNGVTCLQLAKIVDYIIENNIYWKGVKHVFSPKSVSKYELVSMINEIYKLNININKFETENKVDKTITTIDKIIFNIPDLFYQIDEMKKYKIK